MCCHLRTSWSTWTGKLAPSIAYAPRPGTTGAHGAARARVTSTGPAVRSSALRLAGPSARRGTLWAFSDRSHPSSPSCLPTEGSIPASHSPPSSQKDSFGYTALFLYIILSIYIAFFLHFYPFCP